MGDGRRRVAAEELEEMVKDAELVITVDDELAERITGKYEGELGVTGVAVKDGKSITGLKDGEEYLVEESKGEHLFIHEKAARKLGKKWSEALPKLTV